MREYRWCPVFPLLLLTAGCVSTLPPPASTYSFDRRCLSISSDVRSQPVSLGEQRQAPNESVEKEAAVQLYSPTTSQTILGVVFGGLANILSGGIGMATGAGDAGNIVSVTGGALEVLFGTSANFTKVRQEFSHPHNHLAAVWHGSPQSEFFSQRAWRFLTEPSIRDLKGHSLRDVMLQTWQEEGKLGESGSIREKEREELLFGTGGVYDSEQLHVREAMLQQLESSIQLMHQELETLLREVLMRQAVEEET